MKLFSILMSVFYSVVGLFWVFIELPKVVETYRRMNQSIEVVLLVALFVFLFYGLGGIVLLSKKKREISTAYVLGGVFLLVTVFTLGSVFWPLVSQFRVGI